MSSRVVALVQPVSFEAALSAAQAQVPGGAEAFIAAHGGWVTRTVTALCRRFGVRTQEHADAEQETYRRLLDPRLERFAPGRGDGKQYVRGVILNAIDFAGRRRRRIQGGTAVDVDESVAKAVDPGWQEPFDSADARIDLPRLLRRGDDVVARAVVLVCDCGLSQRDAAKKLGVSEFKLCRALAKFSAQLRSAA